MGGPVSVLLTPLVHHRLQTEGRYHPKPYLRVIQAVGDQHPFRVVLGRAYRGLTGGFLLLRNFSVAISVSPHVCFILVLILISMFLRLCINDLGIYHKPNN